MTDREPLTAWGEAELRAEMAALADEMLTAADVLEKVSAVYYGDAKPAENSFSAAELRIESAHIRAEGANQ